MKAINSCRHIASHHIPIINKPFQDLAVITHAIINGYTDLPILPVEIELLIAEQVEHAILQDEISLWKDILQGNGELLYQNLVTVDLTELEFIKLLKKYNLQQDLHYDSYSFDSAANNGHIDIIEWLHAHCYTGTSNSVDWAAENGHLNTIKWLHSHDYIGTEDAIDLAAQHGHVETIEWLYEHSYKGLFAIDLAAKYSHIKTIECLLFYDDCKITTDTFDGAAEHGRLETIKWLHDHGYAGTANAIDHAAGNGYFDLVQFLYDNGYKATECAINWAAEKGYLDIIQFLHNHGVKGTENAFDRAAGHGHIITLKWLHKNGYKGTRHAIKWS